MMALQDEDYAETVEAIEAFIDSHHYCPTVRDIGEVMGISSPSTIHKRLTYLREQGYVDWLDNSNRTLHVTKTGRTFIKRSQ